MSSNTKSRDGWEIGKEFSLKKNGKSNKMRVFG